MDVITTRLPAAVPAPLRIILVNLVAAVLTLPLLIPLGLLVRSLLTGSRDITTSLPGMMFAYVLLLPSVLLVASGVMAWLGQRACGWMGMRALPIVQGTMSIFIAGLLASAVALMLASMLGLALAAILALALILVLQLRVYRTGGVLQAREPQPEGNTFRAGGADHDLGDLVAAPPPERPATAVSAAQLCVQLVQSWRALDAVARGQMPASGEGLLSAEVHAGSQRLGALGAEGIRLSQRLQASHDVNERYAAELLGRVAGAATALGAVARWEEWRVAGDALTRLTDAMTASEPIRDWVRRMYAVPGTQVA